MARALKAVILHGVTQAEPGADERDTLLQAQEVRAALTALGFDVRIMAVGLDLNGLGRLRQWGPVFVFNLVEALGGDGRLIHLAPSVLEAQGVPHSGASAMALFTSSDKPFAKHLMRQAGVPTPDWVGRRGLRHADPAKRYIVKSVWEHASFGLDAGSIVPGARVAEALAARERLYGGEWFAEAFIEGREFNLGLIETEAGVEILPIAEMTFVDFPPDRPHILDYAAKWDENDFAYSHTARRFGLPAADDELLDRLRSKAKACWHALGLNGYARVDFRVDRQGQPWVLEINANPCLAQDAGFMAAAEMAGHDQKDIVAMIVKAAGVEIETHRLKAVK